MCSAVCFFAPHSQAAVEAISHLCVSERNRTTSVRRRLSLTRAGLGKLNPDGVALASLINLCSLEAFSHHSMFHLNSVHRATLMPDWAGLFNSSSAASTNECLDLSCHTCPQSGDRSLLYKRYPGSSARVIISFHVASKPITLFRALCS